MILIRARAYFVKQFQWFLIGSMPFELGCLGKKSPSFFKLKSFKREGEHSPEPLKWFKSSAKKHKPTELFACIPYCFVVVRLMLKSLHILFLRSFFYLVPLSDFRVLNKWIFDINQFRIFVRDWVCTYVFRDYVI